MIERNSRLKLILFEQHMTQKELAERAGIPSMYISLAINGRYNFNTSEQISIANALNEDVNYLFSNHPYPTLEDD